ncbi:type II secretion system F family protein [bacterium CPR1]|nr:type II secretion system F family protein [bacterium CPR1]
MPEFLYIVKDREGNKVSGEVHAATVERAARRLQERGYTVIRVDLVKPKHWIWYLIQPVKPSLLVLFVRQMATMVAAGVTIRRVLNSLMPQHGGPMFRKAVERLQVDVNSGYSLSQAMMRSPEFFSYFVVGSVRIGEHTGRLAETLDNCAGHLEKEFEYGLRLKQALIYPVVLLSACGVLVGFIFTYMIPKFVGLFVDLQVELPWATQKLMDITGFLETYATVVFFTGIGPALSLSWLFFHWSRTRRGRLTLERVMLRIPWYGLQIRRRMLAQYFRSFGTLIDSGVTADTSLALMGKSLNRVILQNTAIAQLDAIRKGKRLTAGLRVADKGRLFPPMALEMVYVGEETGTLPKMLERLSSYYDEEMVRGLDAISRLVEPVVLCVIGSMVAFVLLAAFMPIYQLASSF